MNTKKYALMTYVPPQTIRMARVGAGTYQMSTRLLTISSPMTLVFCLLKSQDAFVSFGAEHRLGYGPSFFTTETKTSIFELLHDPVTYFACKAGLRIGTFGVTNENQVS